MTLELTTEQTDRAVAAILGAAGGDALGAGYEFATVDKTKTPDMIGGGLGPFAPYEWTDDTSLTWCVLDATARGQDLLAEEGLTSVAKNLRAWYESSPPDIGVTTSTVLRGAGKDTNVVKMMKASYDVKGVSNGSLMRTAPVALAHLDSADDCWRAANYVSALTHSSLDAREACGLWSLAIRHAILTGEFDIRSGIEFVPDEGGARTYWTAIIEEAETKQPEEFSPNGSAVRALQAAWSSVFHCQEFEASLHEAIWIGHDTDTVASIAGALLGAKWGTSVVPLKWRENLHGYPGKTGADLEELALLTVKG